MHRFLVGRGTKWAKNANIWPKMGVSKSFGTLITEKPHMQLVGIVFGHPWDQMGQKCQYLAKKGNFGPNLAIYEPKILILMGGSKSFASHIIENPLRARAG